MEKREMKDELFGGVARKKINNTKKFKDFREKS
jgi:hypothetical protein